MIKTGWQILTVEQIILKSLYNLEFVHIWDHVGVKFILTFTFFQIAVMFAYSSWLSSSLLKTAMKMAFVLFFHENFKQTRKCIQSGKSFVEQTKIKVPSFSLNFKLHFSINYLIHISKIDKTAFRLSHFSSCQFFSLFSGICTHLCLGHNCIWLNWPVVTFFLNSTSILDKTLSK